MATNSRTRITVQTVVKAPVGKVWKYWNEPEHITHWSFASNDWHAPSAINDLRPGGKLIVRMEAKDGSAGFDFGGTYDVVKEHEEISFTMGDGRRVDIVFTAQGDETKITETFDAENTYPLEFQQAGWQSILDNFKRHAEQH
ncbi:Activator of Hsp90 ATPase 1 family protein [Thermobacillus xylanilyticus]|uniref:Activator of Hsp90 ATPase 1 family protein n=1 Tax=Thermobacillus xylanilyticus TaxID=76633 RepID=A0ABN7RX55_THEXY|nr:SRPBCC family protein [Thermobacillus xylanilyticus]CAG5082694.1 Activator of Hsp90 ATPase 1 family protein [Thermobacillus xylanilyticus]